MPRTNKRPDAIIRVRGLEKTFGDMTAVKSISFAVKRGEILAFLGPNGAGKTTTIKMLTTILRPTKGEIVIDGHDALKDQHAARASFGIVFQDPSTDDELTALENMELHGVLYGVPRKERRERIERLLKMVDLWDRKDSLAKTFSGGMKRRLEIARGLLHSPKVLFLDEPTAGLDPQTRNKMWEYLQDLNKKQGITIFFTTHYLEEAQKAATAVAIIDRGTIVAQGTSSELIRKAKVKTLEAAFLKLTGHGIRADEATSMDTLRLQRRAWGGKR